MKRILLGMLICGSTLTTLAQDSSTNTVTTTTTTSGHKYVYYPSENVYFDNQTNTYWYQDKGSQQWTKAQTLPPAIVVDKAGQQELMVNGANPWINNAADIKKYKVKKDGTVKIKMKEKNPQ
jgi:hypothetical protein